MVRLERTFVGEGTIAVITSAAAHVRASAIIAAALGASVVAVGADGLGAPVSVLTVRDAKGLEFDTVVVLEPAEIIAESARGLNDLYVALTRPTQRLHVVHALELPAGMSP